MTKLLLYASLLIALASSCASSGIFYSQQPISKLPKDIELGKIEGPGSQYLIKTLGGQQKKGGQRILSGHLSFSNSLKEARETIPLQVKINPGYEAYLPDPFTGKVWRTKTYDQATEYHEYPYELIYSEMSFDWQLNAPDGQNIKKGHTVLNIGRSYGGFLASKHMAPAINKASSIDQQYLEKILAKQMAHLIELELGRDIDASALESASDKQSQLAKKMAQNGDWEAAKNIWYNLLQQNSRYAPAHYNLGVYWERQGENQKAWNAYREAFLSSGSAKNRAALTRLSELLEISGMKRRGEFFQVNF